MERQIKARQINEPFKRLCDWNAPGHNKVIMPNKPRYQVVTGDARGNYHSAHCYQAALKHYQAEKAKLNLQQKINE